jgi:hypothetical protein
MLTESSSKYISDFIKNNKAKLHGKADSEYDICNPDCIFKLINLMLQRHLVGFVKNNKKPFQISLKRNTIIIQYSNEYDMKLYDVWYSSVKQFLNTYFYKKELDVGTLDILDPHKLTNLYNNKLYTTINNKDYQLCVNIVIKSVPIYRPHKKLKNIKISEENKEQLNSINNKKKKLVPKQNKYTYYDSSSQSESSSDCD